MKEGFEKIKRCLDTDDRRFFKLFEESMFEGSRAAALEMTNIAEQYIKQNQKFLLSLGLRFLIRSDLEMLSWPNSPLLVMLQFVDPNVLFDGGEVSNTPLHVLCDLAEPSDYSTHENQLVLAKQLIEHGANVKAVSIPHGKTPLHNACFSKVVTNLDFVKLLLESGADPNAQDRLGMTPLMWTIPNAPGAAKFLLNWPTTDANITTQSGASFLARVRSVITDSSYIAPPGNPDPDQIQHHFLLQQWRDIEEILVERDAHDTGIATIY
jgi:hypothetical protein